MKKTLTYFLLFCCFVFSFSTSFSQITSIQQPGKSLSAWINNSSTFSTDTCIFIEPDSGKGKNASIWNIYPNNNYSYDPDFIATAWTYQGNLTIVRGLIYFDIYSAIPANAVITSATLSLYHHTSVSNIGHSTLSGSNESWLRRITIPWNETTVTWNNQPSYTTQNQVYLPATTNDTMDYPNIDVTNLINDILNNPTSSYGIIFMQNTEQYYRSMLFASSNAPEINKRPKLEICYHLNSNIPENNLNDYNAISIYPNPANYLVSIDYTFKKSSDVMIDFYSVTGKLIDQINMDYETGGKHNLKYILNPDLFPSGIYMVKISADDVIMINRFVKID